jgi:hypothetical protein
MARRLALDRSGDNLVVIGIVGYRTLDMDDAWQHDKKDRQKREEFFDFFVGQIEPFTQRYQRRLASHHSSSSRMRSSSSSNLPSPCNRSPTRCCNSARRSRAAVCSAGGAS